MRIKNTPRGIRDIHLASIYTHLDSLIDQGFAEGRSRTTCTVEQLRIRGGKTPMEYKLSSRGIQNRGKYNVDEELPRGLGKLAF